MLKEIDDNNSILTVQQQYRRLARNPIHEEIVGQIEEFLQK